MKEGKRQKITIYNCHTHTFRIDDVPRKFLPLGLIRLIARGSVPLARILNDVIPGTDDDVYDRYANFLRLAKCTNQLETLQYMMRFYPTNARFVILSMDMHFMGAGQVPRSYEDQLKELSVIKKTYPDVVFPFLGLDPRRKNLLALAKDYVENHGFCGFKLYPPLGYFPNDERLFPLFDYAEEKSLPIIVHSSKNSPVYSRAPKKQLMQEILRRIDPSTDILVDLRRKSKKDICNYFTHPFNYKTIIKNYPKLKISFAHFGGISEWTSFLNPSTKDICEKKKQTLHPSERSWFEIIYDLLKIHKNLYADISYTLKERSFFTLLKVLLQNPAIRSQLLFGSDFFMVESKISEKSFGIDLHGFLGTEDFHQITQINPEKFLLNSL